MLTQPRTKTKLFNSNFQDRIVLNEISRRNCLEPTLSTVRAEKNSMFDVPTAFVLEHVELRVYKKDIERA